MINEIVIESLQKSIAVKQAIVSNPQLVMRIDEAANAMISAFTNGDKVLFCGNGGSAADAQHLAAELSGRFYYDRPPLYAEALHVNSSFFTAVTNDYSVDAVYQRMVQAAGRKGDVLVAISTSGNSINILNAIDAAKKAQMFVIGLTGNSGGEMAHICDVLINVPSTDTPRIQEAHITIGHILCQIVESTIFPNK
ncbi:MAG: SIS domain-containing protein [Bacteroidota bacterium]|jgi:D-sedoheptulose 7-phosphate isomerase